MKIGNWNVSTIVPGTLGLDGGSMFGVVPKTLWQRYVQADESNRITLATRNMLLRSDERTILVDVGNGDKWDSKLQSIYGFSDYSLEQSLMEQGVRVEDVTDVVFTHLHFDHAGGATKIVNGKLEPRFPNAKYHVQKDHLEWAKHPTEKDRVSFMKDDFEPLIAEGMWNLIDGEGEFAEGIELIVMQGHTKSMQLVKVSDGGITAVFCADLIPTAAHLAIPYVMSYDNFPLTTLEEKKKFLARASDENWLLVFEHDTATPAATVVHDGKYFKVKDVVEL